VTAEPGPPGTPPAEVEVSAALVRELLAEQHPDLAEFPVAPAASGWDNVTYRLGEDLAVRLPRRAVAAALLEHEQRWLSTLAPTLPLPIPAAIRHGSPGRAFPWAWSVVPWFDGHPADRSPPGSGEAAVLGSFLRALHVPAPATAPKNPHRGVPIQPLVDNVAVRLRALADELGPDTDRLLAVLDAGAAATEATTVTWIHGDLHPRNILTSGDLLSAVIDWGDLTRGDPATDIAALWMLYDASDHPAFWETYGRSTPGLHERSRAWAVVFGSILLAVGLREGDEGFVGVGRGTLARLAAAGGARSGTSRADRTQNY
jgi:aminoglycoside phosphotransferase (APT) family kinase protein